MDRETYNLLEERIRYLEFLVGNQPVIDRLSKLKVGLQEFLKKYSAEHPSLNFEAVFDLQRKYANCEEASKEDLPRRSEAIHAESLGFGDLRDTVLSNRKVETEVPAKFNHQLDLSGRKAYLVTNYEQIHDLLTSLNELFKLNFDEIIDSKFPTAVVKLHNQLLQLNKILHECMDSEVAYLTLQSLLFAENYIEVCLYYNKRINSLQKSLIVNHDDEL